MSSENRFARIPPVSIAASTAALLVIAWSLVDSRFRDLEGFAAGTITFPLSVAVGLLIVAAGWGRQWMRSSLWLAMAVVAQSAAIQLVNAGPRVGYQHLAPFNELAAGTKWVLVVLLLFQAAITAVAIASASKHKNVRLTVDIPKWRIVVAVVAATLLSSAVSRRPEDYALELLVSIAIQLVALGNVALFAMHLPDTAVERLLRMAEVSPRPTGNPQEERRSSLKFVTLVMAWTFIITLLLAWVSYERHPHIPDEVSYLIQAGYFAGGELFLPAPAVASAFDIDLMHIADGKWYSPFPPGWPAVLALGTLLGAPWLINPMLSAIAVPLVFALMRSLTSTSVARLSALLLASSPWFLFMGMSFMSHTLALVLAVAAAVAITRVARGKNVAWALAGGAVTGWLSLARPLDGLVVAAILAIAIVIVLRGKRRVSAFALFTLACGSVGAIVLPYNRALTGNARLHPLTAYFDSHYQPGANDMGFGPDRGLGWTGLDPFHGHGAVDVVVNTLLNGFAANIELFGWATGSLLLVLAYMARYRLDRIDRAMCAIVALVVIAYSVYWFGGGPDFGARYWFLILVPCLLLSARAIVRFGSTAPRILAGVAALSFMSLTVFVPWRAIDKYHHYRGMRPGAHRVAKQQSLERALVMIVGQRHPDYASAAVHNARPLESGQFVFAWARSPAVADSARAAFPDRHVLFLSGPSVTGRGFAVADTVALGRR